MDRIYQHSIDVIGDLTEQKLKDALQNLNIEVVGYSQEYSWDYEEYGYKEEKEMDIIRKDMLFVNTEDETDIVTIDQILKRYIDINGTIKGFEKYVLSDFYDEDRGVYEYRVKLKERVIFEKYSDTCSDIPAIIIHEISSILTHNTNNLISICKWISYKIEEEPKNGFYLGLNATEYKFRDDIDDLILPKNQYDSKIRYYRYTNENGNAKFVELYKED